MLLLRRFLVFVINVFCFTVTAAMLAAGCYYMALFNERDLDFALYFKNTWWAMLIIWALIRLLEFLTGKKWLR